MFPPVFATCFADATCKELLGSAPMRLYPFGRAPEDESRPYAVWQTISGTPGNYIGNTPDMDSLTTQIDVYATNEADAREVAKAIRNAIEPVAHITSWRGEMWDNSTELRRYSFDVEWIVLRTGATTQARIIGQDGALIVGQDGGYIAGQAA